MQLPNFVIKYAMEKGGSYIGGPVGLALAGIGATSAFFVEKLDLLAVKLNDQTARWPDVVATTVALEAALYSAGVYGTAVGSATVVAPGVLVAAAIISAGVLATYYQNPVASLDALESIWAGIGRGDQPWTIAAAAAKAYSTEIDRQKIIDLQTNTATTSALNWVPPRRDPLILDLDGGGIKTSGINPNAPILFDQDSDGTLTATGWVAAGEGIVVRDLNGNGLIDSGRELFGENTVLQNGPRAGQLASNGFDALADLDSNADGKFDANDVAFASVKIWKDLNQDSISQSNELFSFADLGVQSIYVSG